MQAVAAAPFKTVDTFIIGEQSEEYVLYRWCWECNDERQIGNMPHDCGLNTPPEAIVHSVKLRTTQTEDDLEDLPF